MHTIEITTTQNVVIQYNLATLMDRVLAFFVDLVLNLIIFFILVITTNRLLGAVDETSVLLPSLIVSFYTLIFERFMNGQTPGKRLLHIQVIKMNGGQPDGIDFFKRWSLRLLDIYLSLGALALLSIGSSEIGQRLGDKVADTIVVKVQRGAKYRLADIIKLARSSDYEPAYPEIISLDETHIINLKRLLKRYEASEGSPVYSDLMKNTAEKIENELNIRSREDKPVEFIQRLIRDYVILTR